MALVMADLTSHELEELRGRMVLLPVGSLEQHGPHLPLDTDSAIAASMARGIADELGALVAPGLGYGYRSQPASGGGEIFPATTSLSGAGLTTATRDVLCALARHGFLELAMVNGHFENSAFIIEAAYLATEQHPDARIVVLNWWEQLGMDRLDEIFGGAFPGWEAEHAGVAETSLMMHLFPDRVRTELVEERLATIAPPTYTVLPERTGLVDPSGVLRTASGSSAAIGKAIYDDVVEECTAILRREMGPRG
jgi:creatinine amidohydrolase